MKRRDALFWVVTIFVVIAIAVLYLSAQHYSVQNATLEFDGKPAQPVEVPFTIGSQGSWATLTFDLRMPPLVPGDFIVYADDCLRDFQVNGETVDMQYDCELVRRQVDLGSYLTVGDNQVVVRIEDFGGVTEFSMQPGTSYLLYILLNGVCIAGLYAYSIYYFRNGKKQK
jgi:hypothetical protein